MEKVIEVDDYLHNLQLDIMHDNSIKNKGFDYEESRINEDVLRDQAYFFEELGLQLHKVYTLRSDVEMELSPQYIEIILSDDNRSIVDTIVDKEFDKVLFPYISIRNRNNYAPRINYIHELSFKYRINFTFFYRTKY